MTIRPDSGVEANISHLTFDGAGNVEISHYDGTREVIFKKLRMSDGYIFNFEQPFKVDNTNYLRVKNVGSAAQEMGYCGEITKPEIV